MAQPVKTSALAAYIDSRNMKFAGAPVTLRRLAQMLAIGPDAISGTTIADDVLMRMAQYLKLPVDELCKLAAACAVPEPSPPPPPPPPPARMPPPGVPTLPQSTSDTGVIPREQLTELVAKSRRSEPVIAVPTPAPAPEASAPVEEEEITITYEEAEVTPPPGPPPAPPTPVSAPAPAATDVKSSTKAETKSKSKKPKKAK